MHYPDQKLADNSTLALYRISIWVAKDVGKLQTIFQHSVIQSLVEKLNEMLSTSKDLKTMGTLVKIMEQLCKSKSIAESLVMEFNLLIPLQFLLSTFSNMNNPQHLDLNLSVLDLLIVFMPPLPIDGIWKISPCKPTTTQLVSTVNNEICKLLKTEIFPLICQVFRSSTAIQSRKKAITAILQILWYSEMDNILTSTLQNQKFILSIVEIAGLTDVDSPNSEDIGLSLGLLLLVEIIFNKYSNEFKELLSLKGYKESVQNLMDSIKVLYKKQYPDSLFSEEFEEFKQLFNVVPVENDVSSETVVSNNDVMIAELAKFRSRANISPSWTNERVSLKSLLLRTFWICQNQYQVLDELVIEETSNSEILENLKLLQDKIMKEGTVGNINRQQLGTLLNQIGKLFSRKSYEETLPGISGNKAFTITFCNFMLDYLTTPSSISKAHNGYEHCSKTKWTIDLQNRISIFLEAIDKNDLNSMIVYLTDNVGRLEKFKILHLQKSTSSFSSQSFQILSNVTRHVRLQLRANEESGIPTSLRSMTVSVPAISSLRTVETYVRNRLSELSSSDSNPSPASGVDELPLEGESTDDDDGDDLNRAPKVVKIDLTIPVKPEDFIIEFRIGDKILQNDKSVLNAICNTNEDIDVFSIWDINHPVQFCKRDLAANSVAGNENPFRECDCEVCDYYSVGEAVGSALVNDDLQPLFALLPVVNVIVNKCETVNYSKKFHNARLKSKLEKQILDPLVCVADIHPDWVLYLMTHHKYSIPFQTRFKIFSFSAMGQSRNLFNWLANHKSSVDAIKSRHPSLVRFQKCKVVVGRQDVFETMIKLLGIKNTVRNELEVEFLNEAGTGLGPTVEFFSIVSKLQI